MKNQRGQSVVEFAFIVPLFMFIALGLIYAGILFMDYLQYNNAARAIAREVAFTNNDNVEQLKKEYFHPLTTLYTATLEKPETELDEDGKPKKVTITIKFELTQPIGLTEFIKFPPERLNDIVYVMPVEKVQQTE